MEWLKRIFIKTPPSSPPSDTPIVRSGQPTKDELALGYAWGSENGRDVFQLKGVSQKDRATHFYVIGGSGTGKTKFLETLINQDIETGRGFGVIDPHGDLAEAAKTRLAVIGETDERIVLIDPTDKEYTACFNPLELAEGVSAAEQAAELVLVFKKIWSDAWGSRMEDLLRNSLIALIENNQTLAEVPIFLTNAEAREKLTRNVQNETCRHYFGRFNALSKSLKDEWTESTLNKVNAFLSDERVRQIFISPKSSFSLRDILDNGKVLLVKLDKGRLKGSSDLLGSLLLSKIQMAAFARADINEADRKPFYLYIDEFQNFATESFIDILAEARKYRLSLTLAHQNLSQLPEKLRASILGNCGLQAYFRISRLDAELLAKESFAGLYAEPPGWETYIQQLQSFPQRTFLVKNKIEGGIAILETPEAASSQADEADLERIGRRYLRLREEVEQEYQERRRALLADKEPESFKDR
jgi:type IV secretory pathway TraG/TraD family ATPase VirD4